MSGTKWFSCLWRGGVCVCVCVHLPHAAEQCTALSHPPLLHWTPRSATGGNWVLSGPFLSLCTAPCEHTAQSPGPQQSCFSSYDISFSSFSSQGFWFVNCLLQSPVTQAEGTNVLACVSSGQLLPPWIRLSPVKQRQGLGARLPGRHHAGQNKWLRFLYTRSALLHPVQEVRGGYCHSHCWARGWGMGLRRVKHQKSCGSYWDSAVFPSKCFYGACNL